MRLFRVITGLRLTKVNRVIHLQIQEGELQPRAQINASTVSWTPVVNYTLLQKGIRQGKDYFTMVYENRTLNLDDLFVESDQVVTGVRFHLVGSHINFEIRSTEFDFETGKLIEPIKLSNWISNYNTAKSVTDGG